MRKSGHERHFRYRRPNDTDPQLSVRNRSVWQCSTLVFVGRTNLTSFYHAVPNCSIIVLGELLSGHSSSTMFQRAETRCRPARHLLKYISDLYTTSGWSSSFRRAITVEAAPENKAYLSVTVG
jgi:hypothetical protein